jgi:hypothetical protein
MYFILQLILASVNIYNGNVWGVVVNVICSAMVAWSRWYTIKQQTIRDAKMVAYKLVESEILNRLK